MHIGFLLRKSKVSDFETIGFFLKNLVVSESKVLKIWQTKCYYVYKRIIQVHRQIESK